MSKAPCKFHQFSKGKEVLPCDFGGESILMLLRHADVKKAAKDWQTYSSAAAFRVPIPSEEGMRSVQQFPIETDPPEHTDYRKIVEPFFKRPRDPDMQAKVASLIEELLSMVLARESTEIVYDVAIPLQSRSLTYLLNVPESEAGEWITWGMHALHDEDGNPKDSKLETYIARKLDHATECPGEDFFSALVQAEFQGRPLTREEMVGFANLTFAGGRDTVIQSIAFIVAYFGENPDALEHLRKHPESIMAAVEEFFRVLSPLGYIGRVCPNATNVHGVEVSAGDRIALGWAAANRDPEVFDNPDKLILDRKPNPHLAFGAGPHVCIGAIHARMLVRAFLQALCNRIDRIEVQESKELDRGENDYPRTTGFQVLKVRMVSL